MLRLVFVLLSFISADVIAQEFRPTPKSVVRDEFPADAIWLNTQTPIHISQLLDKIVALNFSSENCVDCRKNVDWLNQFAHDHREVQVISVMKKDSSFSLERFKRFLFESGISHPVAIVNDFSSFVVSKPDHVPYITIFREDAKLYLFGNTEEELPETKLEALDTLFQWNRSARTISLSQLSSDDLLSTNADGLFRFPHYMDISGNGKTMFISDAGHHRIAVVDSDGEANIAIGSTSAGNKDGNFAQAQFNHPGGISYDENSEILYIADTYNHRICAADFKSREVNTILSQPKLRSRKTKLGPNSKIEIGLPTDVLAGNRKLYITSAWDHVLYEYNPADSSLKKLALIPSRQLENLSSSFPTNLSVASDSSLAVVNSDGSVYEVSLAGRVEMIVDASAKNLANGISSAVKFNGHWYFTNSQSNQVLQLKNDNLVPLNSTSDAGWADGKKPQASFYAPTDIVSSGGKLFVVDSYNHLVRILSGKKLKVRTLALTEFDVLARFGDAPNTGEKIFLEPLHAAVGKNHVTLSISVPGHQILATAQNEIHSDGISGITTGPFNVADQTFSFDFDAEQTGGMIQLEFYLTVASEDKPQAVYLKTTFLNIPVEMDGESASHRVRYSPNIGW